MGAAAFFNPALVASPLFDKIWASLVIGGIGSEAAAVAGALTSNRGTNITSRQVAAYRQIIYGTQRVGGTVIYRSTTGSTHNQYNMVIALAGHQCHSIEALYLDGRLVHWDTSSHGNSTRNGVNFGGHAAGGNFIGPDGSQYGFGGLVYCEARFGDQVDGDVITAMTSNDPVWAATPDGRSPWVGGCTYVYLKIQYDATAFPGEPEIRFTINGKCDIYDPRTDSRVWTNNWALVMADILSNSRYGLSATYGTDVNTAQMIAAANICEEPVPLASGLSEARYLVAYHYDTATSPGDAMQSLMASAAGRISFVGGEWFLYPAAWTGPSFNFTEQHLAGPITETPVIARRDLCNRVTGTYTAPNWPYNQAGNLYDQNGWYDGTRENTYALQFQATSFPAYSRDVRHGYGTDQDLIADGGRILVKDIDLRPCLSLAQAQRVAKIHYMRVRAHQYKATYPMSLATMEMQPNDTFNFNFNRLGMTKTLEVLTTRFSIQPPPNSQDDQVPVFWIEHEIAETGQDVYAWSPTEELTIYDNPAMSQINSPYLVAAPTNLTISTSTSTGNVKGVGGDATNYALAVIWTAPLDSFVTGIQVQAKLSSDVTWFDAGTASVASMLAYVYGIDHGSTYDIQIRSVSSNDGYSVWVQQLGFTA